jgi:hypothetical protein
MQYLFSRRVWGGVVIALAQVLPYFTAGTFGGKPQAIATGIGAILYAVGAVRADGKVGLLAAQATTTAVAAAVAGDVAPSNRSLEAESLGRGDQ